MRVRILFRFYLFISQISPADKDHPFGHERTETIASLFVGILILVLGFETAKESISKVIHPGSIDLELHPSLFF